MVTLSLPRPHRCRILTKQKQKLLFLWKFKYLHLTQRDVYGNAAMQNCMKLDSLKAIYCTYPTHVTNRLDFLTYHAALRIQIKRGNNNPVVSDILNKISSSFTWPAKSHNASQDGN